MPEMKKITFGAYYFFMHATGFQQLIAGDQVNVCTP